MYRGSFIRKKVVKLRAKVLFPILTLMRLGFLKRTTQL